MDQLNDLLFISNISSLTWQPTSTPPSHEARQELEYVTLLAPQTGSNTVGQTQDVGEMMVVGHW